jgi:hypothetical protein
MTQEALKLALDALENHTAIKHPQQIHYRDKAIAAIKEALAQEQELELEPAWPPATPPAHGRGWPLAEPPLANARELTWVGLTDSQRKEIERQSVYVDGAIRMTEDKLKEKNT